MAVRHAGDRPFCPPPTLLLHTSHLYSRPSARHVYSPRKDQNSRAKCAPRKLARTLASTFRHCLSADPHSPPSTPDALFSWQELARSFALDALANVFPNGGTSSQTGDNGITVFWIGASDRTSPGTWRWLDGEAVAPSMGHYPQYGDFPSYQFGTDSSCPNCCAIIRGSGYWTSEHCDEPCSGGQTCFGRHYPICEGTTPPNSACDERLQPCYRDMSYLEMAVPPSPSPPLPPSPPPTTWRVLWGAE